MTPGIAIFGTGSLARLLVEEFSSKGMKIVAVWSHDIESAKCFALEHEISTWACKIDNILLLPVVHLVVIACAPHFHSQIFSKACQIGKHVICSLPPCETVPDILHMQDAASNYSALITLFLSPLRLLPSVQLMRRLLLRDKFVGSIRSICGAVQCDVQNREFLPCFFCFHDDENQEEVCFDDSFVLIACFSLNSHRISFSLICLLSSYLFDFFLFFFTF